MAVRGIGGYKTNYPTLRVCLQNEVGRAGASAYPTVQNESGPDCEIGFELLLYKTNYAAAAVMTFSFASTGWRRDWSFSSWLRFAWKFFVSLCS